MSKVLNLGDDIILKVQDANFPTNIAYDFDFLNLKLVQGDLLEIWQNAFMMLSLFPYKFSSEFDHGWNATPACYNAAECCEFRVSSFEFRVSSFELRVASCELRVASCVPRAAHRERWLVLLYVLLVDARTVLS